MSELTSDRVSGCDSEEQMLDSRRLVTSIALIKVGALGDVVRTTTLLPAMRKLHPNMDLTWVTGKDALPLLHANPDVARIVLFDDSTDAFWRHVNYDWVICLDDDEPLCALASELRSSRLSGAYKAGAERRYTDDLAPWFSMGLLRPANLGGLKRANEMKRENASTYGDIVYQCLGLQGPVARPFIGIPDIERATAGEWFAAHGLVKPVVAMNTGAGARWRFKSWGEGQTAELARRIVDRLNADVVILGGAAEKDRNDRIVAAAGRPNVCAAPTDLNLLAFAAYIERCNILISSDSLGLHLASALKKPIVAFFGPTSSAEIDLYGSGEKIETPLECAVCYLRDCDVRPHCMDSIPVERMFDASTRQLAFSINL
jgi:ADP-heptose:LPS heptosyltransferase